MSYITPGILGFVAVAATLGAVQVASGQNVASRDVTSHLSESFDAVASANVAGINRDAKSDRATTATASVRSQTVSINLNGMDGTSILVRVPVAAAGDTKRAPSMLQPSASRRAPVACEPMVSALSEVARQLQPGRCVT